MRKDFKVVELKIDDSMAGAAIMILSRQLIIILIPWQGQPWLLSWASLQYSPLKMHSGKSVIDKPLLMNMITILKNYNDKYVTLTK